LTLYILQDKKINKYIKINLKKFGKMKNVCNIALATIGAVSAADWNYDDLGKNWETDGSVCKDGMNQSPIDLTSEGNKENWDDANYKVYDGSADQFTKMYENPF